MTVFQVLIASSKLLTFIFSSPHFTLKFGSSTNVIYSFFLFWCWLKLCSSVTGWEDNEICCYGEITGII